MSDISILTPSWYADFERCKLLCESIDLNVTGHSYHYIIVNDADFSLFKSLENMKRKILKYSDVIPSNIKVIPRIFKNDYWVSFQGLPMKGWQVQQIVKIAATAKLPEERVCIVDSDMIFIKKTDLSVYKKPHPLPFYVIENIIPRNKPRHIEWIKTAYKILDLGEPDFPIDDHIGSIIIWDKATVLAMIDRIEMVTGKKWSTALNQAFKFSEYLLYGYFVNAAPLYKAYHVPTDKAICHIYWSGDALDEEHLKEFILKLEPHHIAVGIQSFTETPINILRKALLGTI